MPRFLLLLFFLCKKVWQHLLYFLEIIQWYSLVWYKTFSIECQSMQTCRTKRTSEHLKTNLCGWLASITQYSVPLKTFIIIHIPSLFSLHHHLNESHAAFYAAWSAKHICGILIYLDIVDILIDVTVVIIIIIIRTTNIAGNITPREWLTLFVIIIIIILMI